MFGQLELLRYYSYNNDELQYIYYLNVLTYKNINMGKYIGRYRCNGIVNISQLNKIGYFTVCLYFYIQVYFNIKLRISSK